MRTLAIVSLLLLVTAAPALAGRSEATQEFFKAYYLEKAKRDFAAARAAYEGLLADPELAWNLSVRVRIGLARIAAGTGQGDAKELLRRAEELMKSPPEGDWDPRDLAIQDSLAKEIDEAKAALSGAKEPDEVAERIDWWISVLASSGDTEQETDAVVSLQRFGRRAIPRLSETLGSPYPRAVSGAARVLVRLGTVGVHPLKTALEDTDVLFPALIAEELIRGQRIHTVAAGAAVIHPDPTVRLNGVKALANIAQQEAGANSAINRFLLEAVDDKEAEVRRIAIGLPAYRWHTASLILALGKTLNDHDPAVAKAALTTLRGVRGLTEDVPEALHSEVLALLRHDDPGVRRYVVQLCCSRGGKLARSAVLRGLADGDANVREAAAGYVHEGRVAIDAEVADAFAEGVETILREDPGDTWLENYSDMIRIVGGPSRGDGDPTLLVGPLIAAVSSIRTPRRYQAFHEALRFAVELDWRKADKRNLLESYGALATDADRLKWLQSFAESLGKEVVPPARLALEAGSDDLRVVAARILASTLGAEEQGSVFGHLVRDRNPQIRSAAIHALSRLGGVRTGKEAVAAYRAALSDPSTAVRQSAVEPALMALENDALPLILAAVKERPELAPVAVQAVAARRKQDETLLFLKKVLSFAGGVTTLHGSNAWAAAEKALTDEMVLQALRRDDTALLTRAARIAGERNLLDAWPILLEKPKIDQVRYALEQIRTYHLGLKEYQDVKEARGGDAASKAAEMAASSDAGHRRAAAYALGALGDSSAIGMLLDLVKDEDAGVREAAMAALKKLGGTPVEGGD